MAKLEKLTSEQEQIMHTTREEWLDRFFNPKPVDELKIQEGVKWLYQLAKKKEPLVVIVKSPIAAQLDANHWLWPVQPMVSVRDSVRVSVRDSVRASVGDSVRDSVGDSVWDSVRASVGDSVRASVGDSVWDSVRASVRASVGDSVRVNYYQTAWYGNVCDYGWVSFFDFFTKIGIINHDSFNKFRDLIAAGVYDMIQQDGLCIVSTLPSFVKRNERGRMHCEDGPAIRWNDGFELFYINGIHFKQSLFNGIIKRTITAKEVLSIQNTEQKTVALKIYGYNNVLQEAGAKVLDSKIVTIQGEPKVYELLEVNFGDDDMPARLVKVVCHSTLKETVLRVDPRDKQCNDVMGAIAWGFGLTKEQYNIMIET